MINNRLTLPLIAFVGLAVAVWVGAHWRGATTAHAATRQTWEYKIIYRGFHYDRAGEVKGISVWREDQRILPNPPDADQGRHISEKIAQLGAEGWELVSVTPYAFNGSTSFESRGNGLGGADGGGTSYNGATFNDLWVFKRPK